jgi:predicted SAM-dependent methyltransferase
MFLMTFSNIVGGILRPFISPGQEQALVQVQQETSTAWQHRMGLRKIRKHGLTRPAKINLGSGATTKPGFLNVYICPVADVTLDLRRPLPFEDDCCEVIFSEHALEHFDYPWPVIGVLRECLRVLKPGGKVTFSVPDTEWPLVDYPKGYDAPYFRACLAHHGHRRYNTRMEHINYHFRQRGEHRFAYDEETALKLLSEAGFVRARKREFDISLDSEHRRVGSLFMEAFKPE